MNASESLLRQFQNRVLGYYRAHGRHDLSWRQPEASGRLDPYKILVSELMLQQTQVNRVVPKYEEFLAAFPTVATLASAPLGQVIAVWSGLGYNRRAKYLHEAAQLTMRNHEGSLPRTIAELVKLPGVGRNTAGAIMAYAYDLPAVFLETNIRTAYIYHFYSAKSAVADADILPLVEATVDTTSPRIWYWALMDYGSYLKRAEGNLSRQSKHYVKQSAFQGSRRQLRGQVLRMLTAAPQSFKQLKTEDERLSEVLQLLVDEGLIRYENGIYSL